MRGIQFIIIVAIIGCCFLPTGCAVEKDNDNDIKVECNFFTPDGEENVFFEVTTEDKQHDISLKIYTRAGVLIFSIEAKRCIWDGHSLDGQPMATGVYYYTAEVRGLSPKISKSGVVHLYR